MTDHWNELNLRMERAFQEQKRASESRALRDHFAAAALTGLLYPEVDDEFAMSYIVGRAYLWADAMLRERCRAGADCPASDNSPNHDAAPAARAGDAGTGDTHEPVAWGVFRPDGEVAVIAFKRQDAEERATASDRIVPLYRAPTLTDAEREAVAYYIGTGGPDRVDAALRGLLERRGGAK